MPEQRPQPPGKRGWRWKRTAVIALLLLVGGAVVNVAVAWGGALSPSGRGVTTFILTQQVDRFIIKYGHNASAGWPARSMKWQPSDRPWSTTLDENSGVTSEQERLPLRPLLPGFIINTLFYTLLFWLLFIAPFAARRMLRHRRGLCEKCAYPIGVSPVCTECGAAVTRDDGRS